MTSEEHWVCPESMRANGSSQLLSVSLKKKPSLKRKLTLTVCTFYTMQCSTSVGTLLVALDYKEPTNSSGDLAAAWGLAAGDWK